MKVMASSIQQFLNKILSSRYGKDVRQAIHDGIEQCYEDGKAGAIDLVAREQIANLVANDEDSDGNSELIDIRVGADGKTYATAGEAVRGQVSSIYEKISNGLISENQVLSIAELFKVCTYIDRTAKMQYDYFCNVFGIDNNTFEYYQGNKQAENNDNNRVTVTVKDIYVPTKTRFIITCNMPSYFFNVSLIESEDDASKAGEISNTGGFFVLIRSDNGEIIILREITINDMLDYNSNRWIDNDNTFVFSNPYSVNGVTISQVCFAIKNLDDSNITADDIRSMFKISYEKMES